MASGGRIVLVNKQLTATENSDKVALPDSSVDHIAYIKLSNRTAGTYTCIIQHPPDGENWENYISLTAISADGIEIGLPANDPIFSNVRASTTVAGGPGDADVLVELRYRNHK